MFPSFILTRPVSIGPAASLESGDGLILQVSITASRGLIWDATDDRFQRLAVRTKGAPGAAVVLDLPRTDVAGWRTIGTATAPSVLLDVSADGSFTHEYTATIDVLDATEHQTSIPQTTIGPFVLPAGDGSTVDLDALLPVSTVAGSAVAVPDSWGALTLVYAIALG
jgi:hypothetical protein